jgi:hypothetical protein
MAKYPVYNNVGVVNGKITTLLPMRGESCQGRCSWRSSMLTAAVRRRLADALSAESPVAIEGVRNVWVLFDVHRQEVCPAKPCGHGTRECNRLLTEVEELQFCMRLYENDEQRAEFDGVVQWVAGCGILKSTPLRLSAVPSSTTIASSFDLTPG